MTQVVFGLLAVVMHIVMNLVCVFGGYYYKIGIVLVSVVSFLPLSFFIHLIIFHIKLRRAGLTTYQYLLNGGNYDRQ